MAEFRLFTTWISSTRDGAGFYSLQLQNRSCFVFPLRLPCLSFYRCPFFCLAVSLSVTKQKKAKEMHLITQGAVVLLLIVVPFKWTALCSALPHSPTSFAGERKRASELACRMHGQCVREEGVLKRVEWKGQRRIACTAAETTFTHECNVRVRKKINLNKQAKQNKTKQSWNVKTNICTLYQGEMIENYINIYIQICMCMCVCHILWQFMYLSVLGDFV